MEVAVRIEQAQSLAQEVERVLQLAARGVIVVMALRVHHAQIGREPAPPRIIKTLQAVPRTAEAIVELVAQVVVHQPHSRRPIAAVARWLSEVLAKNQRVIARNFSIEIAVAVVVPVAEAARHVELPLDVAAVAEVAVVLVELAIKIVRHVLHRVQAQAVELGHGHFPAHRAQQIRANVLFEEVRILRDDVGGQSVVGAKTNVDIGVGVARPIPHIPLRGRHVGVGHPVIEFRIVRVAHIARLGIPVALVEAVVLVGRFVGNVNQVRQPQMHHLPRVVPIAAVVPLAVKPVFRAAQVKIFRAHAGIHIHRCRLVIAGDVERAVVHDVVSIDPQAEPVRGFDQVEQLRFGAVARCRGAALVPPAQVERIPQVIAHGKAATTLGRRWDPNRGISGFGQLRDFVRHFPPACVEVLQHGLAVGHSRQEQSQRAHADDSPPPFAPQLLS